MSMSVKNFALDDDHTTRAWIATVWFLFAALIITAPAAAIDTRTLWEISVWSKPMKFELALMVHFATLAILAQLLPRSKRTGFFMTPIVWASVAAALLEIVYITLQAARGRHSHFNSDTDIESGMYTLMGLGAVLLVVAAFVLGLKLSAHRDGDRSGLRLGAVIGLLLAPILTLIVAGYMSSSGSHWVGEATSDANGVLLFGWSRKVGDFRPAHFVALHSMQGLPIIGMVMDRIAPKAARPTVLISAVIVTGITAVLFLQALAGRPLY